MPTGQRLPQDSTLSTAVGVTEVLTAGELEIKGRIMPASNATFLGEVSRGGTVVPCVYKPVRGEQPLWDFPDGTLADRERAAYLVSRALGWDLVPLTVLREGPAGPGMVQQWQEPDPEQAAVDVVPTGRTPRGYLEVFEATDDRDRPVTLIHEDTTALRRLCLFDALVNNADRKGGHVLAMADGHRYGVDHGLCFHQEPKLRTVLWGWSGQPLSPEECSALTVLHADTELAEELAEHLTAFELDTFEHRISALLGEGRFPEPGRRWPVIPWPAF